MIARIIFTFIVWIAFSFVIIFVPYPQKLIQANLAQILLFFTSLFLALSSTLNLFIKNFLSSGSISLGLMVLLILNALGSLNIVTGSLTIIAIYLFVSYFRKTHNRSLTKLLKIPKLTRLKKK